MGDLGRFHNNFAGTPLFGLGVAAVLSALVWTVRRSAARGAFLLTTSFYWLHVLMDFFTVGRGIMLFWPFSSQRIQPPLHLFYGLRWSDGLVSERHIITLVTEIGFAGALFLAVWVVGRVQGRREGPAAG